MYRDITANQDPEYVHDVIDLAYLKGVKDAFDQLHDILWTFTEPKDPKIAKVRDIVDDVIHRLGHLITEHEQCLPPFSHIQDELEELKKVINAENYEAIKRSE
jgi:hypothetical protein